MNEQFHWYFPKMKSTQNVTSIMSVARFRKLAGIMGFAKDKLSQLKIWNGGCNVSEGADVDGRNYDAFIALRCFRLLGQRVDRDGHDDRSRQVESDAPELERREVHPHFHVLEADPIVVKVVIKPAFVAMVASASSKAGGYLQRGFAPTYAHRPAPPPHHPVTTPRHMPHPATR
jgi:hypothetical protein